MTSWLKWRLVGLFGTVTLLSGGYWLQAQEKYPPPAKTPEKAAETFFQLLAAGKESAPTSGPAFGWTAAFPYAGSISQKQMQAISNRQQNGGPERLFRALAEQAQIPQFTGRVTKSEADVTVVEVTPAVTPKGREVIVVPEDGGYRVDLKATFGKWNNLSGTTLDEEWYRYTGLMSPALQNDENFLRSTVRGQGQTNLKQVMLGVLQYVQDYDERLPRARAWQPGIQPYVRNTQIYTCPALPSGKSNGYAFNQKLSQIPQMEIKSFSWTVNFYETSNLAPNVFGNGTGRAYRHTGGSNLAFTDGHIKWYKQGTEQKQLVVFNPK